MHAFFHELLEENNGPNKLNATVQDSMSYTWFGRPNYAVNGDTYWVGGVKNGLQYILKLDTVNGEKKSFPVGHQEEEDDHNQAQILIRSSDNRILTCYAGHNSDYIGVRISKNPLDAGSFENVNIINTGYSNSYPSPYQAANGDIFIFYRARGTEDETQWHYIKSLDGGVTWSSETVLWFYPTFRRTNYLISYQDGDNLHFIGTPGNPQEADEPNLKPYHFVFDLSNETVTDSAGNNLTLPITPNNATEIFSDISGFQTTWILDVITVNGVPRMLFVYFPDADPNSTERFKERYIYFSEWNGSSWDSKIIYKEMIGYVGEQFRASVVSKSYCGVPRFSASNTDIIFAPKKVKTYKEDIDSRLELFKYDLSDSSLTQLTFDSKYDNWRPISLPVSSENLIWIQNIKYITFLDIEINLKTATINV